MSEPLDLEPIKARLARNRENFRLYDDRPAPKLMDDVDALVAEVERLREAVRQKESNARYEAR